MPRTRPAAALLLAVLALAGCTDDGREPAASPSGPLGVPAVLRDAPAMAGATRVLAERGHGPQTVALPDLAAYRSLVFTVVCDDPDSPFALRMHGGPEGAGAAFSAAGCGAAFAETPPLDRASPYTDLEVQVASWADYAVYVYGTTPASAPAPAG